MENCYKCGVSEDKMLLYDVVTIEGIQKLCRICSLKEDLPMMNKKCSDEIKEIERKQDVYERISKVSSIDNKRKLNQRNLIVEKQDASLRDLVEKNVCKGLSKSAKPRIDLIRNFHWLIKRYRRVNHLTTKQLAKEIGEAEKTIDLVEQGIVPEGYTLIRKIENRLGVVLIKDEIGDRIRRMEEKNPEQRLVFDPISTRMLTIADLNEIKRKKELESNLQKQEHIEEDSLVQKQEKSKSNKGFFSRLFSGNSEEVAEVGEDNNLSYTNKKDKSKEEIGEILLDD